MPISQTTSNLRKACKENGIKGFYKMKNEEMVSELTKKGVDLTGVIDRKIMGRPKRKGKDDIKKPPEKPVEPKKIPNIRDLRILGEDDIKKPAEPKKIPNIRDLRTLGEDDIKKSAEKPVEPSYENFRKSVFVYIDNNFSSVNDKIGLLELSVERIKKEIHKLNFDLFSGEKSIFIRESGEKKKRKNEKKKKRKNSDDSGDSDGSDDSGDSDDYSKFYNDDIGDVNTFYTAAYGGGNDGSDSDGSGGGFGSDGGFDSDNSF